jgi:two-component system sensor histidine kinase KdpD
MADPFLHNLRADSYDGGKRIAYNVAVTCAIQALTVLVAMGFDGFGLSEATVVIVFVLGVLLTAIFTTGRVYCLAASALSILCFNFFLVDPRFSFRIRGADVPGTIAVMFVVALIASYLVTQMRENARKSSDASFKARNEQLRADLLRSVSHDLRTPLTSISGNADMLLDEEAQLTESQRRQLVQDIYEDATWLKGMVENLLAITRLEDGTVSLKSEPEIVDDVVEEAMRHVSRDAEVHRLVVVPSDELLLAQMDAQVIVQVLVNLVNNAIAHTDEGSTITISTRRVDDFVEICVADDGLGVSDADKLRVFEPFYTTGRAVADSRRGIGLGLTLCRSIVEAHGGAMRVDDVEPHGAAFVFTLPLVEMAAQEEAMTYG